MALFQSAAVINDDRNRSENEFHCLVQWYTTFSLMEAALPIYFNLQPPMNLIKNISVRVKVNTFSFPGLLLLSELKYLDSL